MVQAARPADDGGRPPLQGNPMRIEGNRRAVLSSKQQSQPGAGKRFGGAENVQPNAGAAERYQGAASNMYGMPGHDVKEAGAINLKLR